MRRIRRLTSLPRTTARQAAAATGFRAGISGFEGVFIMRDGIEQSGRQSGWTRFFGRRITAAATGLWVVIVADGGGVDTVGEGAGGAHAQTEWGAALRCEKALA